MARALNPARVLWAIREGVASTTDELYLFFREYASTHANAPLRRAVKDLCDANLIETDNDVDVEKLFFAHGPFVVDANFTVTPEANKILDALGLRLSEITQYDPSQRMIFEPSLERLEEGLQYKSDILVFMPFTESLRPVYDDHLKAVSTKLEKTIRRGDDFFATQEIISDIWTALLETEIVIADCTGRNPNVFYELGLAHAVGKPTILITQNDDVPFDLRHRRYIKYELTPRGMKRFEEELEKRLYLRFGT